MHGRTHKGGGMSHLVRATELWNKWERKEISDYALIKEQRDIIHELSDEVIRLETENAALREPNAVDNFGNPIHLSVR